LAMPTAALSAATVAQLIGERAIELYSHTVAIPETANPAQS
jgi:hypothetical protein